MKLRITAVIDGVTLPDFYFDHPNFQGATASVNMFAESAPGVTDKYALTAQPIALTKTAATFSANDSRNPVNYTP